MNKEYYTPDIEDFFIGYDYEYYILEDWQSVSFHPSDIAFCEDWLEKLDKNLIRTPYLTEEQIEKEGWEKTMSNRVYKKDKFNLGYLQGEENCPVPIIWIESYNNTKYGGNCPSINEFRKICKLLNIE